MGAIQVCDSSGAVVIDLSADTSAWVVNDFATPGVTWNRQTVTSPWVDGDFDVSVTKSQEQLILSLTARGASAAVVDGRLLALIDAVSASGWVLRVQIGAVGRAWRCKAADVVSPLSDVDVRNNVRTVTLSIPANPNPTITGTV